MDYFRMLTIKFNLIEDLNIIAKIKSDFVVFKSNLKTGNLELLVELIRPNPRYYIE